MGTLAGNARRSRVLAITAVATMLVSIGLVKIASATSGTGPSTSPYDVPVAVDEDPADPTVFETTITADETPAVDIGHGTIGGSQNTANVLTFNGSIPGPEIRVNVDDTVIVHFQNHLDSPTGIHWHGIELDNASDGTPLTQNLVPPGGKFLYKFRVPRPGIYWYHPHHHSSTNQVFKGLYGSIIVTDPATDGVLQANGVLPPESKTKTLVLGDMTVCSSSDGATTYPADLPWAGGPELPVQQGPHPSDLCDTHPVNEDGDPIVDGSNHAIPFADGDVPNVQNKPTSPSNEGNRVLTNGKQVRARAGSPYTHDNDGSGPQFPPGPLDPGSTEEPLHLAPGDGVRLRLINTANIRYMRLRLTATTDAGEGQMIPLVRIGGEGGLLDNAVLDGGSTATFNFNYDEGEILLGPGERADVVADFPSTVSGIATLWTGDFMRVGSGAGAPANWQKVPTVPVAHFDFAGTPSSYSIAPGAPLRTHPDVGMPIDDLSSVPLDGSFITPSGGFNATPSDKRGMANQTIELNTGGGTFIDHIAGLHEVPAGTDYTDAPKVGSTRYAATVGSTLEIRIKNTTAAHHPFHPHGFSVQPIRYEDSGGTPIYTFPREFVDEVDVPPMNSLVYRVRLDDRPLMDGVTPGGAYGRWVFHCHIFFHAVFGMISEIIVTDANGNERPYVNSDFVEVNGGAPVNPGDPISMTGKVKDIDHDAVTLTASTGTVTDHGDGTWTWNDTADQGGLVYVTATDATGKKDQTAFEVNVPNDPPAFTSAIATQSTSENNPSPVSVSATFHDANASDGHTGTIDWGDGSGPHPATITEAPGATDGTLSGSFTYGDNGTYHALATVTDPDGASATQSFDVVVSNVNPDGNIDKSSALNINGTPTIFATAGVPAAFRADISDPGSDDLTTRWNWGDGSALDTQVSRVNPPLADPANSPSIQPRAITHNRSHAFSNCAYTVTFTSADDDGGTDSDNVAVIVTGTTTKQRGAGWWQTQYKGTGKPDYTPAQLDCLLKVVNSMSVVFSETRAATTRPQAYDVLWLSGNGGDERQKLDRALMVAWLNFSVGSVKLTDMYDTDGDGIADTSFASLMATAEAIRNDPASSSAQLQKQRQIVTQIGGA